MDYEIVIISNRPHLSQEAQSCLKGLNTRIFDGTGYPSFSKLVNDSILSSNYETIIICNDKARPTPWAVRKILNMLNEGWGLVQLYRLGFFGFKKDLIRKIGFFDERYVGGGHEENDLARRLKEANIAYFESIEIDYLSLPTSWHYEKTSVAKDHFQRKWKEEGNVITRQLAEEDYKYDLGPFKNTNFIEFNKSIILPLNGNFKEMTMQVKLLDTMKVELLDYEIVIISNRPHLSQEAQLCLKGLNTRIFDGTNYPSFSKLVNDSIISSNYETIIICNDKARPTYWAAKKILDMLNEGWGLVALYRFGFFGFKKDLIRKIGFFDERYVNGGYEDCDFVRRLKEANIAYYENEEIDYLSLPTSWHYEKTSDAKDHFQRKWKEEGNVITRQLAEEDYKYDLGPFKNTNFIEFNKSIILPLNGVFKEMTMQVNLF